MTKGIGTLAGRGTCPRCLDRHLDDHLDDGGALVMRTCRDCKGVSLPKDTADFLLDAAGIDPTSARADPHRFATPQQCSGCSKRLMYPLDLADKRGGVSIDRCVACFAIWLDPRELERFPPEVGVALQKRIASTSASIDDAALAKLGAITAFLGAQANESIARQRAARASARGVGQASAASRLSNAVSATEAARSALDDDKARIIRMQEERAIEEKVAAEMRGGVKLAVILAAVIGLVVLLVKLGVL